MRTSSFLGLGSLLKTIVRILKTLQLLNYIPEKILLSGVLLAKPMSSSECKWTEIHTLHMSFDLHHHPMPNDHFHIVQYESHHHHHSYYYKLLYIKFHLMQNKPIIIMKRRWLTLLTFDSKNIQSYGLFQKEISVLMGLCTSI